MKKLDTSKIVLFVITTFITILPMFVGMFLWNQLPDLLSMEFATNGAFGSHAPKWVVVYVLPLFFTIAHMIAFFSLERAGDNKERFGVMAVLGYVFCPAISIICAGATFGQVLGWF